MLEHQIKLLIDGINKGYTIEYCCINILGITRYDFYNKATKKQKSIINEVKLLNKGKNGNKYNMTKRINNYDIHRQ